MNEVAKSRKQNNDKKETNERICEMESRTRIQVAKSMDFFDGILLLSLCFFGKDGAGNELEMKS